MPQHPAACYARCLVSHKSSSWRRVAVLKQPQHRRRRRGVVVNVLSHREHARSCGLNRGSAEFWLGACSVISARYRLAAEVFLARRISSASFIGSTQSKTAGSAKARRVCLRNHDS